MIGGMLITTAREPEAVQDRISIERWVKSCQDHFAQTIANGR